MNNLATNNDMDIELNIALTRTIITFPPDHTNFQYFSTFSNIDAPTLLEFDEVEHRKTLNISPLPTPLIQFINTTATKNTALYFRLINVQKKLKLLHEHKAAGTFPPHYKVKLSVPNNNLISSEQLSQLALSSILLKDLQKTQADFTTRLSTLNNTNTQLLFDCNNRLKGVIGINGRECLLSDYDENPILSHYHSQVTNTIVRFNQNTINHQNKAELEKTKKLEKRQKFQDSLRKQSTLLTTSESPNIHNEPALLQKEIQSLRSLLAKRHNGQPKNGNRTPKLNPSSPPKTVQQNNNNKKKKDQKQPKQNNTSNKNQNEGQPNKKKKNQRKGTTGNVNKKSESK